jgi:hypothetical protein
MTQDMRLLSVEQLRFISDTAYGAGVRASQDELRRIQSVETESKERILRLEGALVKEAAINAQLLEALEATTAMLDQSDCLTGYCCCGSAIDGHGFGDGHTPVDEGAYHQAAALGQARAAIAEAKEQA